MKYSSRSFLVLGLLATLATFFQAASSLNAATGTWAPTATGTYYWYDTNYGDANSPRTPAWGVTGLGTDASPFILNPIPNGVSDTANLNIDILGNQLILLDAPTTLGILNLGDADGSHSITIAGGQGGSLVFNNGGVAAQLNKAIASVSTDTISANISLVDNLTLAIEGGRLDLTGVISGTSTGITKQGAGSLLLSGASTFTGNSIIDAGTILLGSSTVGGLAGSSIISGPLGTGTITINSVGPVVLQSNSTEFRTLSNNIIANGNFTLGATGTGSVMLGGTLNLGGGLPRVITAVGNQYITGIISGGGLSLQGTGTVHFRGVNTFTGASTLGSGTTAVIGSATTALGTAAATITAGGNTLASDTARTLVNNFTLNGNLTLGADPRTVGNYDGQLTLSGTMNLGAATRTITVNTSGVPTTISTIADTISGAISNGGIIKEGNGRLILSGANTTITGFQINAGVLQFNTAATSLGNNPASVAAGVNFFTLNGGVLAFNNAGSGAPNNAGMNITANSTVDVMAGTLVMFNNTAATMTGSGDLTKLGTGGFTLVGSGTSTWTGNLNIVQGTVIAGTTGTASNGALLAAVNSIAVQSAATFRISNGTSAAGNNGNRVNNAAGITMNGGLVEFDIATPTAGIVYSETLGATTLNRGANGIVADQGTATTSTLTFSDLIRNPGATVNFASGTAFAAGTAGLGQTAQNSIILTLLNGVAPSAGFIGGWATVNTAASTTYATSTTAAEWAKYDSTLGVQPFLAADYNGGGAFAEGSMTATTYHAKIAPGATATTVTLGGARTAGSLHIFGSNAAGNLTINQAGSAFTIDSGGILVSGTTTTNAHSITGGTLTVGTGNELIVNTVGTNALNISSTLGGTMALTKSGTGVLALTGTNTFTGDVYLNQGTIRLASGANGITTALGSSNTIKVVNGTIASNAATTPLFLQNDITIYETLALGDSVGTGPVVLAGDITLSAPTGGIVTISPAQNATVLGSISGGSLRVAGSSQLRLAGNNNFASTERIQVDTGGILSIGSAGALDDAMLVMNGGVLATYNGYRGAISNDVLFTTTSTLGSTAYIERILLSGNIDLGGANRTIGVNGFNTEFSGRVTNGGLTKNGGGLLVFSSSTSDYLGGTSITDGVIRMTAGARLGANVAGNDITVGSADAALILANPDNIGSNQILTIAPTTGTTDIPALGLGAGFEASTNANPLIDFNNTGTGIMNVRITNTAGSRMIIALDGITLNHDLIAETNAAAGLVAVWIGTTTANGTIAAPLSAGLNQHYRLGGGVGATTASNNAGGTLTVNSGVLSGTGTLFIGNEDATTRNGLTAGQSNVFIKGPQSGFSGLVSVGAGGSLYVNSGAALGTGTTINLNMGGVGNGLVHFGSSGYSGFDHVNNTYATKNINVISDSRIRSDADGGGRSAVLQFGTLTLQGLEAGVRAFEVQDASNNGEIQFGTVTLNAAAAGVYNFGFIVGGGGVRFENGIVTTGSGTTYNLTKTGGGTLIIDGTGNYNGTTTLANGTIMVTGTNGLSSNGLILTTAANTSRTLVLANNGATPTYNFGGITATGNTTLRIDNLDSTGPSGNTVTLGGNVSVTSFDSNVRRITAQIMQGKHLLSTGNYTITGLAAADTLAMSVAQGSYEISGVIDSAVSTTAALTKEGRGMLTLSGDNLFTSATTSLSLGSGTVVLAHDNAAGGASKGILFNAAASAGLLTSGNRTIANNITLGGSTAGTRLLGGLDAASSTYTGTVTNTGTTTTLALHAYAGGDTTFSNVISSTTAGMLITKVGNGLVVLSGNNTFGNNGAVGITIHRGILEGRVTAGTPFGNAVNTMVLGGGTLRLTGSASATTNTTLASLTVGGNNNGGYIHLNDAANGDGFNTQFTFGSLARSGRGTAIIIPQFGSLNTEEKLTLGGAANINGILAPWILTQASAADADGNFVTITAGNVANKIYAVGDQGDFAVKATTAASVFDNNVATTLLGNKDVFALRTNGSIDLGGFRLSLGDTTNIAPATNLPVGAIILNDGAGISNGTIHTNASETIVYVENGTTSTISANFRSPGSTDQILTSGTATLTSNGITKVGTGTLVLSGVNGYTGPTTVSNGILRAGVTNALGQWSGNGNTSSSALVLASGGTFELNGFDQKIGSLSGGGKVIMGGNRLISGTNNTATTFSGQITGTAGSSFIHVANTLDLTNIDASAQNSFGDGIFIDGGTVRAVVTQGSPTGIVVNDQFFKNTASSIAPGTLVTMRGGSLTLRPADSYGTAVAGLITSGINVNSLVGGILRVDSGAFVGAFDELKTITINDLTVNHTTLQIESFNQNFLTVAGTTTLTSDARFNTTAVSFAGKITATGNKGYTLNLAGGGTIAFDSAENDYAGGTVITGGRLLFGHRGLRSDDFIHNWSAQSFTYYNSLAKAGTGHIIVNPNSQIRLHDTNLNAGQWVFVRSAGAGAGAGASGALAGNQSRLEIMSDVAVENYNLRSTTSGALTLMTGSSSSQALLGTPQLTAFPGRYTQQLDMVRIGNGYWGLAAEDFDVTYDVATLGAGMGNTYRFYGGGGQLSFARSNVVTGNANVVLGLSMVDQVAAAGSSGVVVAFQADQNYTGNTLIHANRTQGALSTILRVTGELSTPQIENYGRLEMNGSGRFTNDAGTQVINYIARGGSSLRLDYDAGLGANASNQGNYLTDNTPGTGTNAGPLTNKWQDNLAMTLNGSQLNLVNSTTRDTVETIGALNVFGNGEIYLENRTNASTTLMIGGALTLNSQATLLIRVGTPSLLGTLQNAGANTTATAQQRVMFANPGHAPTVVNGMVSPRFIIADNGNNATAYRFATYNPATGFSVAAFTNTVQAPTGGAWTNLGTSGTDIVTVNTTAITSMTGASDIYALHTDRNITSTHAINIRSGGFISQHNTSATDVNMTYDVPLTFFSEGTIATRTDAVFYSGRRGANITSFFQGNVTAAGLVANGQGRLQFSGTNSWAGTAQVNGGILTFQGTTSATGLTDVRLHSGYYNNIEASTNRNSYGRLELRNHNNTAPTWGFGVTVSAGVPYAEISVAQNQGTADLLHTISYLTVENGGAGGTSLNIVGANGHDLSVSGTTTLNGSSVGINTNGTTFFTRLEGQVTGAAKLIKSGDQELTLTTSAHTNNWSGGTVINNGLVDINNATSGTHLGTGPIELNRGTLRTRGDTSLTNYFSQANGMMIIRGNGSILDTRSPGTNTTGTVHLWGTATSVLRTEGSPVFFVQSGGNKQLRWQGDVVINDNAAIRVDGEADAGSQRGGLVLGHQLSGTELSGSGYLYKFGGGTLNLNYNVAGSYSGGIQLSQGILRAGTTNDRFTSGSTGEAGIWVLPGSQLQLRSAANVNNSTSTIRQFHSNSTATAVLTLINNATFNPTTVLSAAAITSGNADGSAVVGVGTGTNGGVLALGSITYTANINMGTLYGGYWFLGADPFGAGTYANTSGLGVGAGNIYRLGGGDGQIVFSQANTFTGATTLLIGKALAFQGGGTVQINNNNTFTGGLVSVTQSRSRFGESAGINTFSNMLQTNTGGFGIANNPFSTAVIELEGGGLQFFAAGGSLVNATNTGNRNVVNFHPGALLLIDNDNTVLGATLQANGGRWHDGTGVDLNASTIYMRGEAVSANTTGQSETIGAVTFNRGSAIRVLRNGTSPNFDGAELIVASLARTGNGTLTLTHTAGLLGQNSTNANNDNANVERLMISGSIGTTGSGIALEVGSIAGTGLKSLVGNDANMLDPYMVSRTDRDFLLYDAVKGVQTYSTTGLAVPANYQLHNGGTIGTGTATVSGGISGTASTLANNGTEILMINGNSTLSSDIDVLALRFFAGTTISPSTDNLRNTITIRSGGLIGNASNASQAIRTNLVFGKMGSLREAFIYSDQSSLTIDGQIYASGITKFGHATNDAGVLSIAQDQANFNGTWTVNGGVLQFLTAYGAGISGTNQIILNGFNNPDGSTDQTFKTELRFNLGAGNVYGDAAMNQFYHGTITAFNQNTIRAVTGNDRQYIIGNIDAKTTFASTSTMPGILQFRVDNSRALLKTGTVTLYDDYAIYVDASNFGPGATTGVQLGSLNNQGLHNVTKLGDGMLYLTDNSTTFTGVGRTFTVNEGAVAVLHNGALGGLGTTAIIDNGGTLDIRVAGYSSTGTLMRQFGAMERWSVDGARSGNVALESGVHLQINADQTGTKTITLNGGSIMGYLALDYDEIAVIRTLGSGVSVNLTANSYLGQPYVGGGNHRFYDIGKVNNYNNPLDPRLQGAMLQIKGNISGNFDLTKIGQDVIVLAGTNTYRDTNVREGVLMAGAVNTLPGGGRVTTSANGVLDLNGFDQAVGSIAGTSGVITSGATTATTLTTGGDNTSTTYKGLLSQGVKIRKVGTGELTLGEAPFTATYTAGNAVVTGIANTANLVTGMPISGPGIPAGATILRILSATSIELSAPATANGSAIAVANSNWGGTELVDGKLRVYTDGALGNVPTQTSLGENNITFSGGTLRIAETFATAATRGLLVNAAGGAIEVDGTKTLTVNGGTVLNGRMTMTGLGHSVFNGVISGTGPFVKTGTGVTTFNGANTQRGKIEVAQGTVALGATGSVHDASWIEVKSGATFNASAVSGGAQVDAVVSGEGNITGTVIITSNTGAVSNVGVLLPGSSSVDIIGSAGDLNGTLTFQNLTLAGSATPVTRALLTVTSPTHNDAANILISINNGTLLSYLNSQESTWDGAAIGNHDFINVTGTLSLGKGGQIVVEGWTPAYGDVLDLVDWANVSINDFSHGASTTGNSRLGGLIGDLALPTLGAGLAYDLTLFNTSGLLVVVPEPGKVSLLVFGLAALCLRRRRPRGGARTV